MSVSGGPDIVQDGLVVYVDFANRQSYISGSISASNLVDRITGSTSPAVPPLFSTNGLGSARFSRSSNPSLSIGNYVNPQIFTVAGWFYVTQSIADGKLIGFANTASNYDRQMYMNQSGSMVFGVYTGTVRTISSSQAYNDSRWHYAVGTYSSASTSMSLYVDGTLVSTIGSIPAAQVYTGGWVIGGGAVSGWPNITNDAFQGYIGNASIYHRVLSQQEIQQNFNAQRSRFGV